LQYKELCLLGKGGFGKVYKAFHKLDKCNYAVKKILMRGEGYSNPQIKAEEILSELRALARLNHRNIVRYHYSWAEKQLPKIPGDSSRRAMLVIFSMNPIDKSIVRQNQEKNLTPRWPS
jgi:serine/threonine protein kinase